MKHVFTILMPVTLAACAVAPPIASGPGDPPPPAAQPPASPRPATGALALFAQLDREAGKAENIVYSPASVDQAFGLLHLGAAGETRAQLERVLPPPPDARFLAVKANDVEVRLANSIWLAQDWRFQDAYLAAARDRYDATAERLDFRQPAAAANRINAWGDKATHGLLPNIVTPDSLDPDMVALLANALYFDGKWATFFDGWENKSFLFGDGHEEPFRLMREQLELAHATRGTWQAVRLPYRNERYAMDVIMPATLTVMTEAPPLADIAALAAALGDAKPRTVNLSLPRFEVDYDAGLIPALQALGLTLPFDKARADLSAMVAPGQQPVYVDAVQHMAKLQVFDEGTRAAAVTTIRIVPTAMRVPKEPPLDFVVDRPFVTVIRDLETGQVLFIGRIAAPKAFEPEQKEM